MLKWLDHQLEGLRGAGLYRERKVVRQLPGGWCEWNGGRLKNFAGNDYLDLSHDVRVIAAASEALREGGAGSSASQLVCGRGPWHEKLERDICEWLKGEACLLFPTGYAANLGVLSGLTGKGDRIFSDELNHASLIDGCRLSRVETIVYRHGDLGQLREKLSTTGKGRDSLVSDTLFSMDGDMVDLRGLVALGEEAGATVIVDEAHALGTIGATGGGLTEEMGIDSRQLVRVGTLSKGLGSIGGFVVGSQLLVDWLWNRARPQIFSTTLPPSACAAASCAIRIVQEEPERRERLRELSKVLTDGLRSEGFEIPAVEGSPVIPVILSDPGLAVEAANRLAERGYLVGAIRPPSVPEGTSRLRITLSSGHRVEEACGLLRSIVDVVGACDDRRG